MENVIPNNCSVLALISKSLSWNIWRVHLRADADQMVPQNWISFHVLQIENVILSNKYCFLARAILEISFFVNDVGLPRCKMFFSFQFCKSRGVFIEGEKVLSENEIANEKLSIFNL